MIPASLAKVARWLEPSAFDRLPGFEAGRLHEAWNGFQKSCKALAGGLAPLRPALAPPDNWVRFFDAVARGATPADDREARQFFQDRFEAFEIRVEGGAFFTGYYEPEVEGAGERSAEFSEPILARPPDLDTFAPGHFPLGAGLSAGRRKQDGSLAPYPSRHQIEDGGLGMARPIVWVRDGVEAFKIHVQGSARVRLRNGSIMRLTYAGRNGRSYSSIGKLLVEQGELSAADMSPDAVYRWIRGHGQGVGEPGRMLLQRNESYIFFETNPALASEDGPIGAASMSLTPLRSIAIDRQLWPYGLPYWIAGDWKDGAGEDFRRMLIGQDTGSAILGAARADIFFGTGEAAGRAAGDIRHSGKMYALLPRQSAVD